MGTVKTWSLDIRKMWLSGTVKRWVLTIVRGYQVRHVERERERGRVDNNRASMVPASRSRVRNAFLVNVYG